MTKGEGLIGLLYAIKGLIEAGVIWILTGGAVLVFFYMISGYIANKAGFHLPWSKGTKGPEASNNIMLALFLLFIIFAIYPLIALIGAIFGVNSSPTGGILING